MDSHDPVRSDTAALQESITVGAAVTLEEVINLLASIKGPASHGYAAMVEHMERIAGIPQTPGISGLYMTAMKLRANAELSSSTAPQPFKRLSVFHAVLFAET